MASLGCTIKNQYCSRDKKNSIRLFEEKQVRFLWNDKEEQWYFSIVDMVGILSESVNPHAYWRKLKQRLKADGNETVTKCHALKMPASNLSAKKALKRQR